MRKVVFQRRLSKPANGSSLKPSGLAGLVFASLVHVWAEQNPELAKPFALGAGAGAGRGGAVHVGGSALDRLSLGCVLPSRAIPAGPLLQEVQGLQVLDMARRQAASLRSSMARDGRTMSDTTQEEAAAAGAAAVVAWRNGADMDGAEYGAAGVCWRAVVKSVASDSLGESIEAWRCQDEQGADAWDSLTGSALPLPPLLGDGSRAERVTRLLFERARAKRGELLSRRVELLKGLGGRGKRAELIDKVHRAAVLLLHGEAVDNAARLAGFNASGASKAGDRLMQAVRRLGFRVQFNLRQRERKARKGAGWAAVVESDGAQVGEFKAITPATAAGWSFQPSAALGPYRGRSNPRVPLLRRNHYQRLKAAQQAAARAVQARLMADRVKRAAKRRELSRAARRADKAAGLNAWLALSSKSGGFWRGGAKLWRG